MKDLRLLLLVMIAATILVSCGVKQSEYDSLQHECDSVKSELESYKKQAKKDSIRAARMHDTISMLSYPADQRLNKINSLISEGKYSQARIEMNLLVRLFPESKESKAIPDISKRMNDLIAKQKAEEERIKALGFKALKQCKTVEIGYNKVSFSRLITGNRFEFDDYGSRYKYRAADRGNTYFTAEMSVTSSSKNPDLPTLAVYSISGNQMKKEGVMEIRFAEWKDYGSYLGNYADYGNDFAKTSTIRFKLGVELSENIAKHPYAVVLKKTNGLYRYENKYDNPPISYKGSVSYPYTLVLDDFTRENSEYVVVKISNL